MDLVKAWSVAVVVFLLGSVGTAMIAIGGPDLAELVSVRGQLLYSGVPTLVVFVLMAAGSAAFHTGPRGADRRRHALAVLGVPVVTLLGGILVTLANGVLAIGLTVSVLAQIIGTVLGWQLVDRLRARAGRSKEPDHGYF